MSYADNMVLTEHDAEKAKNANGKPFKVDVISNIGSARILSFGTNGEPAEEPGTLFFPYDANGTMIFNGDEMRAITKKDMTEGAFTVDDNGNLNIRLNTEDTDNPNPLTFSTGSGLGFDASKLKLNSGSAPVTDLGNLTVGTTWVHGDEVKKGLYNILSQGTSVTDIIDDGLYSFNYAYKIGGNGETKINNCMMMAFSTGTAVSQIVFSNSFGSTAKSPGIFMRTVDVGLNNTATTNWTKYPADADDLAPTSW